MQLTSIKEIIIPLSDYATVTEDASLYDAVTELEKSQREFKEKLYPHSAVIVLNANNEVTGQLTHLDALKALEPKYFEMGDISSLSRFGISNAYMKSMIDTHDLFEKPLDHVCRKAATIKVRNFLKPIEESEFIDENATLNEAIHQFVVGNHLRSILVRRDKKVIGILRLPDIFHEISNRIQTCER